MPYFITEQNLQTGRTVEMSGDEARHVLLSRRAKIGERIKIQGTNGERFEAEIIEIGRNLLKLVVREQIKVPEEPKVEVVLFQAVVAEQALDVILQKSTELRAAKIVLFNSERVATKLSQDRWQAKKDRWSKILLEAAKQSERAKPPFLEFAGDFQQAVEKLSSYDKIILLDPGANKFKVLKIEKLKDCALVVGPEGGLNDEENKTVASLPNCTPVSLGPILLRADTAAISSLAIIQNLLN